MKKENKEMAAVSDKDKALELLKKEQAARAAACTEEINAVLKQHSCTFNPLTIIAQGKAPVIEINIIAL